jgi:hypothetical protein
VPLSLDNPRSLVDHPEIDLAIVAVKVPKHYGVLKEVLGSGKIIYSLFQLCPLARTECDGKARFTHPESFVRLSIIRKVIYATLH